MSAAPANELVPNRAGADPYLFWGLLTDFRGNARPGAGGDGLMLEFLLECDDGFAQPWRVPAQDPQPFEVRFESIAAHRLCDGEEPGTGIYSVSATRGPLFHILAALGGRVRRLELSSARAAPPNALFDRRMTGAPAQSTAERVLVVIDDGFGFLNTCFRRDEAHTRIHAFWDQDAAHTVMPPNTPAEADPYWQAVHRFGYGRELTGEAINRLIERCPLPSDEPRIYRDVLGYRRAARTLTHGTQVAAWAGHGLGDADFDVILVQFPGEVVEDTSGAGTARHVADALLYALERVGPDADVVVNISFGAQGGPHDGSTLLERALDRIIPQEQGKGRNFAVVLPAGNSFNSRSHAGVTVAPGASAAIDWQVRTDDPTESFCELWYEPPRVGSLEVTLVSPTGSAWGPVGPDEIAPPLVLPADPALGAAVIHSGRPQGRDGRALVLCALGPTAPLQPGWVPVAAGTWQILLRNRSQAPLAVDAWIQRDNAVLFGSYASRQSQFIPSRNDLRDSEDDVDDDLVKRRGTGNSLAHGRETIAVGACYRNDLGLTGYSGMAPREFPRPWPDVLAAADRNRGRPALLGEGTQSGTRAWMNGTSVAAPQVSALILHLFTLQHYPSTDALRAALRGNTTPARLPQTSFEEERRGGGAIETHGHRT